MLTQWTESDAPAISCHTAPTAFNSAICAAS